MTNLPDKNRRPFVSIVIPTYNCSAVIGDCLKHLFLSSYTDYEILVADDGSSDDTAQVVTGLLAGSNGRVFRLAHRGPAAARNSAVMAAKGDYILFLDSDILCGPDVIFKMVSAIDDIGSDCLGVRIDAYKPRTIYEEFFDMHCRVAFGVTPGYVRVLPTACLLVKKDVIMSVGLFDESFMYAAGEDYDLCRRIVAMNDKGIFYLPSIHVYHRHPCSLAALLRRIFFYSQETVKVQLRAGVPRDRVIKFLAGHYCFIFYSLTLPYAMSIRFRLISIIFEIFAFFGRCRGVFLYCIITKS